MFFLHEHTCWQACLFYRLNGVIDLSLVLILTNRKLCRTALCQAHESTEHHRIKKKVTSLFQTFNFYICTQNKHMHKDPISCNRDEPRALKCEYVCLQLVQQKLWCRPRGWEVLSKLEFRLNDAGRLLVEAGVGRKLMDNPEEGRKDCHLPMCYLHLLQSLQAHTHTLTDFITFLHHNRGGGRGGEGGGGLTPFYRALTELTRSEELKVLICQDRKESARALLRSRF